MGVEAEGRGMERNLLGRGSVLRIGHVLHLGRWQGVGGALERLEILERGLVV